MPDTFYITTPIYYVNDEPHLGHAYCTVLADSIARYARLGGKSVFFLTGVDEHGQKAQNAARKLNEDVQPYVDRMARRYQDTWQHLEISNDDFIRTTQERHVRVVQHVLQDLWQRGEIYRGEYEGWYCVPDERFWTEKDAAGGVCPDCGRPLERIVEANYFFRMSAYQDWLIEYIQEHPDFIRPEWRRNEVLGFLRKPLGDLCISRPAERLSWGIPLPFDPAYVTYVWFDALLNYVTAAGYLQDPVPGSGAQQERFEQTWPHAVHLIGKDILTTHAVYWPTMLKAAGLPQPAGIFAHGWWVLGGAKMSKSLGNVVRPLDLAETYGVDAFRYFLMRDMAPGQDADFSEERLLVRYQTDLANNLGNLLQRVTQLIERHFDGCWPAVAEESAVETALRARWSELPGQVLALAGEFNVPGALALIFDGLTGVNQYLEQAAPWKEIKTGNRAHTGTVLVTAAEALRVASVLLWPVLPERAAEIWRRLGWQASEPLQAGLAWGGLRPGTRVAPGAALFPRK